MANPWFRMYAEFATDPKVQMLSESNQRRYIMLLCLRCSNGDVTLQDCEVAFQLRISNEEWTTSKAVLVEKNLIDSTNSPVAWDKRQYASDSSAARVAKHREGKKQACNVTVTPPDTDTDTDTEEKKEQKPAPVGARKRKADRPSVAFEQFWAVYPRGDGKQAALRAWNKAGLDGEAEVLVADVTARKARDQKWKDPEFIPFASTYINQERWRDEWQTKAPAREQSEWELRMAGAV